MTDNHSIHPTKPMLTHIALRVEDIDKTIKWYENFTHLQVLFRSEGPRGYNAWMGDPADADSPFVLVFAQFFEGCDPFAPAKHPVIGPFAHFGIELPSREQVDQTAERAREHGCLEFGPKQMETQIGYICFLKDPDGNTIELSYDQGIYEKSQEVWGDARQ